MIQRFGRSLYVSFLTLQYLPYFGFYGKITDSILGCMNELKSLEIKWKIMEYGSVKEKIIPVFEALVLPTA